MMFTTKFKVLVGIALALIAFSVLLFNQFLLQRQLNMQAAFDTKVMKEDKQLFDNLQKVASPTAKITPKVSPVGKLLAK